MFRKKKNKQKERLPLTAFEKAVISWSAPEYLQHKRGIVWKTLAILSLVAAILFGFYYHALTFSLAIVAFVGAYYATHRSGSKNMEVKISDIGLKVGNKYYPYGRIKSFWILYQPPLIKTLNIHVPGEFVGEIQIQLGDQDPAKIREFLLTKIPEMEGKTLSSYEIIQRILKI